MTKQIEVNFNMTSNPDRQRIVISFSKSMFDFTESRESILHYSEMYQQFSNRGDAESGDLISGRLHVGQSYNLDDINAVADNKLSVEMLTVRFYNQTYGQAGGVMVIDDAFKIPHINITYTSDDDDSLISFCLSHQIPIHKSHDYHGPMVTTTQGSEHDTLLSLFGASPKNYYMFVNTEFFLGLLPNNVASAARKGAVVIPNKFQW